jgi:hypothetical protein
MRKGLGIAGAEGPFLSTSLTKNKSSPLPDLVMCPQLEMPFHFLDRVLELGALSLNQGGEEIMVTQILRFEEVHP